MDSLISKNNNSNIKPEENNKETALGKTNTSLIIRKSNLSEVIKYIKLENNKSYFINKYLLNI